jgi:hypothetical protein
MRAQLAEIMAEIRNLTDVAETFWPYDGPHNAESVTTAAYATARLTRYLANATQPHQGTLDFPSTVDNIVGNAIAAASGLRQVLGQLAHRMRALAADDRLYDDRGGRQGGLIMARQVAIGAAAKLAIAQAEAHNLTRALTEVSRSTSHLGLSERSAAS